MKHVFIAVFCALAFFACHKEKPKEVVPDPEPVKTGTVNLSVVTIDSLGDLENNRSGVNVSLYGTGLSTVTDATGLVTFNNVSYGDLYPVLQKSFYEGTPLRLPLNSGSASATLYCAKYCAYQLKNFAGFVYTPNPAVAPDSIAISFNLDRPVPAGKFCKIAILFSDTTINPGSYTALDTVRVYSQSVQKLNIARLPNLKSELNKIKNNRYFNICAVPVSYGMYYNNTLGKQVLIGENPYFPYNLSFKKTW